ncbi:hypothetical protein [Sporosarcina sp. NPDC096371]|uniref:hypothetical protein n=1 Tax=Sporosarcina sp. NPDC096371 TaxID=3364530 RepID=UPI0038063CB4
MKVVLQSIIAAIAVHIIYIVGMMVAGYIKTKNYKTDAPFSQGGVVVLQDEIAFGLIASPSFGLLSITGVAILFIVMIGLGKKILLK